jgi:hypothetical protein
MKIKNYDMHKKSASGKSKRVGYSTVFTNLQQSWASFVERIVIMHIAHSKMPSFAPGACCFAWREPIS